VCLKYRLRASDERTTKAEIERNTNLNASGTIILNFGRANSSVKNDKMHIVRKTVTRTSRYQTGGETFEVRQSTNSTDLWLLANIALLAETDCVFHTSNARSFEHRCDDPLVMFRFLTIIDLNRQRCVSEIDQNDVRITKSRILRIDSSCWFRQDLPAECAGSGLRISGTFVAWRLEASFSGC
jgi:hypothetical protein